MTTVEDVQRLAADFESFHARFADLFVRPETRHASRAYLRGLLSGAQRKNTWQMAEALGEHDPQALQRLLYQARWDADAARDRLEDFVVERFGDPQGIGVLDESAVAKQGMHSVGVKRQWCGRLGKQENCQVGVYLAYVSPRGHTFLDRRLYLPEDWCADEERLEEAKVPVSVQFATKPELGRQMLEHALGKGVPMRWVAGDEVYGNSPELRDWIDAQGLSYVMAIAKNTQVFASRATVEAPRQRTGGRPQTKARLAPGGPPAQKAEEVVTSWPASAWARLSVGAGEKGPRLYDWACARVWESRSHLPGREMWLVARRSVSDPKEIAYYYSNAPRRTSLYEIARVAAARWPIEQCLREGKGDCGLDEYEVRYFHSWYRHVTLSIMAHAWLASVHSQETMWMAGKKEIPRRGGTAGTRRGERAGGAPSIGDCPAVAASLSRADLSLVHLAALQATTGSPEPLSTPAC